MQTEYELPGSLQLRRLPYRKNDVLQAWDAADNYLLSYLANEDVPAAGSRITILNDGFGALALALHRYRPTAISDSFLSRQATLDNARLNNLDIAHINLLDSLSLPDKPIDYLLIKAPKTLALLEYQLHTLRPLLKETSRIIVAGMVKTLTANVWKCLERLIGPTRTSLAVKKARLIFASLDSRLSIPANPYPVRYRLENTVKGIHSEFLISNHANVFSRDSLDIGTRFLLQHLPDNPAQRDIIDLGCGNGIVGLVIGQQLPDARIRFVDESYMAIASAKDNFMHAFAGQRQAEFIVGDCLTGFPENSADCIVCNPPFHQQHVIGDQIAWQMFQQARRVLRQGGELRVIGNRHLNYHVHLKKLFGNWDAVAGNAKFAIIKAGKR
ncbi:methyltransferase [Methylomonas rivi]|uniref:Ribosomal RNA large subunit methyltransferase G n=1 Tax=Methylomonas rivi TaxID=2952226 RepID=A0ABT1U339_9GAMM|nr:methyltransferase [Methylomonas sp. WSC-6]MCQ8128250.1 methyltransferase [Methylomonas sp. WSC-6]